MKPGSPPSLPRDDVLAMLAETMKDVRVRIADADPETPDGERLLIDWIRTQGYLAGQYRLLKRDTDIDEMEDDLQLLVQARDLQEDR